MADPVQGLRVTVDDDQETVRIDPVSGTVETDQPDGGVIVQLDAHRAKDATDDDFFANLVEKIDAGQLSQIANDLHEQISADDHSRGNYLQILSRGLQFLGTEIKEPRANAADTTSAVEGQATVTNPLLLEALLKSWANARSELLPSEGPIKISDEEVTESEQGDELAEALERDMNHYLTVTASEYYPDTSHMLLWGTLFGGSGFKKIYRCPMRKRPVSESVDTKNLIVSDTTKNLKSCARITHEIPMRPSLMKRMRFIGAYKVKSELPEPSPTVNPMDAQIAAMQGTDPTPKRPEDQPFTLWESQCELDLPDFAPGKFKNEGIPLPYLVTIDKDSREILSIRRNWDEDDEDCERQQMYVKYPYVPGPGFYGTGLLHILGNASMAMTAAWRLSLDASMYNNFPAGVISKLGGRQNTSNFVMGPGTFTPIETNGLDIRQIMMPFPYKDVSPGMMALIDKITTQCQGLGGAPDIPTAEGVQNVPVGTMLAQVEQATKIMAAAHKDMCVAMATEFELIIDLFRRHPEDFWKANKIAPPNYWDEQKFLQALNDYNLVPRADPNTPSHLHRVAKGLALTQLIAMPAFTPLMNATETLKRVLTVIREDPTGLLQQPPQQAPAPDPNMISAQAKLMQAQTSQFKAQSDAQNNQQETDIKTAELGTEQNIATTNLAKEMVIHGNDAQQAQQEQALNAGVAAQKHGLAVHQAAHNQTMDLAQHALDVHTALNPPTPEPTGTP